MAWASFPDGPSWSRMVSAACASSCYWASLTEAGAGWSGSRLRRQAAPELFQLPAQPFVFGLDLLLVRLGLLPGCLGLPPGFVHRRQPAARGWVIEAQLIAVGLQVQAK